MLILYITDAKRRLRMEQLGDQKNVPRSTPTEYKKKETGNERKKTKKTPVPD